jgi:hypothetical protein
MAGLDLWGLELDQWAVTAWQLLVSASQNVYDPFRCPAVSTLGIGGPESRTVILRDAMPSTRCLVLFTDARSSKVAQINRCRETAWVFYNSTLGLQLRTWAVASLHQDDEIARTYRMTCSPQNLRNYQGDAAPGATLETAEPVMPVRAPGQREDPGNFLVVSCQVHRMDALLLGAELHRRVDMRWRGASWASQWISP